MAVSVILSGVKYSVEVADGSLPSFVYLMVAPDVAQLIVTANGGLNVPPGGLKLGGEHSLSGACAIGVEISKMVSVARSERDLLILSMFTPPSHSKPSDRTHQGISVVSASNWR